MGSPYLSEIRIMSFNYPPRGWALANGQILPINQNQALFSLLGTTYGGDGRVNFALPDMRSRTPIHFGNGHILGERGGIESVAITTSNLPSHTHTIGIVGGGSIAGNVTAPGGKLLASSNPNNFYTNAAPNTTLNTGTISIVGGSQAHENRQPLLTLSFCIALQGIFPSQN